MTLELVLTTQKIKANMFFSLLQMLYMGFPSRPLLLGFGPRGFDSQAVAHNEFTLIQIGR